MFKRHLRTSLFMKAYCAPNKLISFSQTIIFVNFWFFLLLESIQSLSTGLYVPYKKVHKFSATSDVRYCVLKPIVRRSAGAA